MFNTFPGFIPTSNGFWSGFNGFGPAPQAPIANQPWNGAATNWQGGQPGWTPWSGQFNAPFSGQFNSPFNNQFGGPIFPQGFGQGFGGAFPTPFQNQFHGPFQSPFQGQFQSQFGNQFPGQIPNQTPTQFQGGFGFSAPQNVTPQNFWGAQTPWGFGGVNTPGFQNFGAGWNAGATTPGFASQPFGGFFNQPATPFFGQGFNTPFNWNIPTPIFNWGQGGAQTAAPSTNGQQNGASQPFGNFAPNGSPIAFVYPSGFVAPCQPTQEAQRDAA